MSGVYEIAKELFITPTGASGLAQIDWRLNDIGIALINYANYIPTVYASEAAAFDIATGDATYADLLVHTNVVHTVLTGTDTDELGAVLGSTLLPPVGGLPFGNRETRADGVGGVADAGDVIFKMVASIPAKDPISGLVIYDFTSGVNLTSPLICLVDLTGSPVIPNTGDIKVAWDNTVGLRMFAI